MGIYADLQAKISADREAGRDVPPVIEEIAMMIANSLDPQKESEKEPDPAPIPETSENSQPTN